MTCFNNGLCRGGTYAFSTVDEFTPAVDASGNYSMVAGSALSPKDFTWTYKGTVTDSLYSENISGAFRLPNGNSLICSGTIGKLLMLPQQAKLFGNIFVRWNLQGGLHKEIYPLLILQGLMKL